MLANNVTSYDNACMTHILWAAIKQKNEEEMSSDYGLSTQGQGQFFPGFPGGGGEINRRLDRLEHQVERLQNQMDRKTAAWIVLNEDLESVKDGRDLILLLNHIC